MRLEFPNRPENVGFARTTVACFAAQAAFAGGAEFNVDELDELKSAVSEAVSNAVLHAYPGAEGRIIVEGVLDEDGLAITVRDEGRGIEDLNWAMEPGNTSLPQEEHMGLGFVFVREFTDRMEVHSEPGRGTTVQMWKRPAHVEAARETAR